MVTILHGLALALYLIAAAVLAGSLAGGKRSVPRSGAAAAGAGVVAHGAGLAAYTVRFGELPLVGLAPSLSTLGFLTGSFLLALLLVREARPIGLVLMPLIAILVATALAGGIRPAGEPLPFQGAWFSLHVVLAFLAYAGLAVAFASGLLYLLQFRELKGKRFGRMFRFFPSLEILDRLGAVALAVGFPALTASLLLGWAWTARFEHDLPVGDPQVVWGILTWFIFAGALAARAGDGARDRRGAVASVVGFVVVVLAYVVLRLSAAEGRLFL